jgi:hypothetical protein
VGVLVILWMTLSPAWSGALASSAAVHNFLVIVFGTPPSCW